MPSKINLIDLITLINLNKRQAQNPKNPTVSQNTSSARWILGFGINLE